MTGLHTNTVSTMWRGSILASSAIDLARSFRDVRTASGHFLSPPGFIIA